MIIGPVELSIVIPCYNEAENLPLLVNRFADLRTAINFELILVDNGSKDRTPEVMTSLIAAHDFVRTVSVPVNQGYGYGIYQGLLASTAHLIGWTHADLQFPPESFIDAMNLRRSNVSANYIKGNRRGRPLSDRFFTVSMGLIESLLFGRILKDISGQPTILRRDLFEKAGTPPNDFSFDLFYYVRALQLGEKVFRFPVTVAPRTQGASSWNTGFASRLKLTRRILSYSFRLRLSAQKVGR